MIDLSRKMSFETQARLLKKCTSKGLDLAEELRKLGCAYDSLRYRDYPPVSIPYSNYETIDDVKQPSNEVPFVSFFAGAGGIDIGFSAAGFTHIASIEINQLFCETLRYNNPNSFVVGPPIYSGDVRNHEELNPILRLKANISTPFDGVFIGGPPCQPFSIAANQRFSKNGRNFKRIGFTHSEYGNLLFEYIRLINYFKPRVFLLENVTGLLDLDGGTQLTEAINSLKGSGYTVSAPQVLNSAKFGVPQTRMRLFVCGNRVSKKFAFPQPEPFPVPCIRVFEKPIENLENHVTREHFAASVLRYMELPYGKRDTLGRVDRLSPGLPSKTVIAGGTKGGGRSHLHPFTPRTLSVRECARLQTFPDSYVFLGPVARQFTQVGNAVPPLLSYRLARAIYEQLFEK